MPSCVLTRRLAAAAACLATVALAAAPAAAQEKDLRVRVKGPDGKDAALFRKLIVAEDGVTLHTGNPPAPKGGPVSPLAVFHLLKTDAGEEALAEGDDLFLRVGKADGEHLGWLKVKKRVGVQPEYDLSPSTNVVYCSTMFVLSPKKPEPDKAGAVFRVFRDKGLKSPLAAFESLPMRCMEMVPILSQSGTGEDPVYCVAFFTGKVGDSGAGAGAEPAGGADTKKADKTSDADNPLGTALFTIISTKVDGSRPTVYGYATETDELGRRVAEVRVLVQKEDLDRLRSTLDLLYLQFKSFEDPAKRKNVGNLLLILKQTIAGIAAGDMITADTDLSSLIANLPVRSAVLNTSPAALASMTAEQFKGWMKNLEATKKRAENLMAKGDWLDVSYGVTKQSFTFLRKSELP